MIKRPEAISVSYLNELGDEIETSFRDFKARMFLHELDHVNGKTMTHWQISEGNIDILSGQEENHTNLMTTVEFYKNRIDELKEQHEGLFEDKRKFEIKTQSD